MLLYVSSFSKLSSCVLSRCKSWSNSKEFYNFKLDIWWNETCCFYVATFIKLESRIHMNCPYHVFWYRVFRPVSHMSGYPFYVDYRSSYRVLPIHCHPLVIAGLMRYKWNIWNLGNNADTYISSTYITTTIFRLTSFNTFYISEFTI